MSDATIVFLTIGVAGALFASGRVRLDVVALFVVLALALTGVLSVREALSGFGDPVVIMVASLLVVGDTLTRTGIAHSIGAWMTNVAGDSEVRLLVLLMLACGILGSVMSSTAVVAVFIPIVLNISAKTDLNPSRLLMPLAYAALISGMMTLIATTPNLVANEALADAELKRLSFFSFTPIGAAVLVVGILYVLVVGRHLLPGGSVSPPKSAGHTMWEMLEQFELVGSGHLFRLPPGSRLVGQTIGELHMGRDLGLWILSLERPGRFAASFEVAPGPEDVLRAGDTILVQLTGDPARLIEEFELDPIVIQQHHREKFAQEVGLATVLIHPESGLVGSTIRNSTMRSTYGVHALGVRRKGEVIDEFLDEPLQVGDAVLVVGAWRKIKALTANTHDFVVLAIPTESRQVVPQRRKAPVVVAIFTGMVALSVLEIVPIAIAVLMAALATVLTRVLTMEQAYRAIHWSSLVLIAGMLPIAKAMVKTGGVDLIVDGLMETVGGFGPYAMLSVLFFVTAILGAFLSNTATAVLMAPIAIVAAGKMGASPQAFVMTIAIAASAAYATPVSSPVVTLVAEPGRYGFMDYVKVGLPMVVLTWVVAVLLIPLLFGLYS